MMNTASHLSKARKASFMQALAAIEPDVAPAFLFELNAQYKVGVVKITIADGFWEQHDGGDEILVILQGRMDFTLQSPHSAETLSVKAGDMLHIPKGVAHGAKIYEEAHVLFFTPKTGNKSWTEDGIVNAQVMARHQ